MDLIKEAFIEGYKQRAEGSDLIFDNTSRMHAITLFNKWQKEQLNLSSVVSSFTFEEVENLLKTQKENCVVAVMKDISRTEILKKISDAPMYDYKKVMNKK
jgi:hypothetical protein